jgi:outer membrane immunogenic protein
MRNLRWIISTAFAFGAIVGIGSATAADLPARTYTKAPAMADPVYNWTGFYIGINGGGGWTRSQEGLAAGPLSGIFGINAGICGLASVAGDCRHDLNGALGGAHFGYNWQAGNWVFGAEASFDAAGLQGTTSTLFANNYTTKVNSLFLQTVRAGYAFNNVLIYGKGGVAEGSVRFTETSAVDNTDTTRWHTGWTAGAGIEYGLTQNWILGVEYDYVALGSTGRGVVGTGGADVVNVNVSGMNTVVGRLSYKFGGPIVAKY